MDDLSLPVHEIPSHGFVEVGEGTNREGTYNLLKRNSFTLCDIGKTNGTRTAAARPRLRPFISPHTRTLTRLRSSYLFSPAVVSPPPETLFSLYRHLHRDIQALEAELAVLRRKAIVHNRWDHRYSKRMAVMANLLLGVWTFWYHFIKCARRRKASIIQVRTRVRYPPLPSRSRTHSRSLTRALSQAMMAGKAYEDRNFHWLLRDGYVEGIKNGWIFFFFSFLLTRPLAWARWLGIASSISWSLYLAIFGKFLPWTNYFNVLANLLYVTASLNRTQKKELPSIDCFLFETERRTTYSSATTAAAAAAIDSSSSSSPYAYGSLLDRRTSKSPPAGASLLSWPPRSNSFAVARTNSVTAHSPDVALSASANRAVSCDSSVPPLPSTTLQPALGLDTYAHTNNVVVARRARSGSFITPPHAPDTPASSQSQPQPQSQPAQIIAVPNPHARAAATADTNHHRTTTTIRSSDTSSCVVSRVPPGDPPAAAASNPSSPQSSPRK